MSNRQLGGARRGLHGKLVSVEANAPEGATEAEIRAVAVEAWRTNRAAVDVWEEIDHDG